MVKCSADVAKRRSTRLHQRGQPAALLRPLRGYTSHNA